MHSHSHPETTEHHKPAVPRKHAEPWTHYTDEQREHVKQLADWQATLSEGKDKPVSDPDFCRPAGVDASAWNRAKNGKYGGPFLGNLDNLISKLRRHYLPQQRGHFVVPHTKVIMDGIDIARKAALVSDEHRGFWLTGDTGVGKTTLAHDLARDKDAVRIHASPAWKTSYTVILRSVARKLGVLYKETPNARKKRRELRQTEELENAIAEHLNGASVAKVLVFEEVRPFNQRSVIDLLFFWLFLLNETKAVLVILSAPAFFDKFERLGGEDAAQFLRRTKVVAGDNVQAEHAEATLREIWHDMPDLKESAEALANAAATLGGFDLLKEVTAILKEGYPDKTPTLKGVLKAINHYDRLHQFSHIRAMRKPVVKAA